MPKDGGNNGRKPHFKIFQISSLSGGDSGHFIMGHVSEVPCRTIIFTGANATIIRSDLAHKLGKKLIWTPPCVILQTVTDDKINVHGKVYLNITLEDDIYHQVAYVADISDPFILGLEFQRENNFKLDFMNKELHSDSEDIAMFKTKYEDIKSVNQVIAKCETTIPPRTETIIPGSVNEDNNFQYRLSIHIPTIASKEY